jgi:hypothetical protein
LATLPLALVEQDYPAAGEPLVYRGRREDLPDFLPWFAIPLPHAWFGALFKERKEKGKKIYSCDAYKIETGYIIYDRQEAYEAFLWSDAMRTLGFAVQVEMAVPEPVEARRKDALLELSVFRPDEDRRRLIKERSLVTTRGQFVEFLKSADFEDLNIVGKIEI